jgi:hypothetical protein
MHNRQHSANLVDWLSQRCHSTPLITVRLCRSVLSLLFFGATQVIVFAVSCGPAENEATWTVLYMLPADGNC